ncbi:MAG TPA: hypothetical protein VMU14_20255 [Acidimicrobiales bacterium]|nr:hypothetical protein [Acidimicrobiales bacterium]
MSILEPGWARRLRDRRRERRWRADTEATVRWATMTLTVPQLSRPVQGALPSAG